MRAFFRSRADWAATRFFSLRRCNFSSALRCVRRWRFRLGTDEPDNDDEEDESSLTNLGSMTDEGDMDDELNEDEVEQEETSSSTSGKSR